MRIESVVKKVSSGCLFKLNKRLLVIRRNNSYPYRRNNKVEDRNGLYTSRCVLLPFNFALEYVKTHKKLQDELGIGNLTFDWLVDEFDSSFNALAAASLKYHMDYAVTYCSPEKREKYQDIINRLLRPEDTLVLEPVNSTHYDDKGVDHLLEKCEECDAISKEFSVQHEKKKEVVQKAREDFFKIMPELWS